MTYKILWAPLYWPDDKHIELESVGEQCEAVLADSLEQITDEQWSSCDALVSLGDVPEPYRSKAKNCRIFVTPKVGFDNIDTHYWAERGVPVCNVPDYGTAEVADHAIALYLSLIRGITFHTRELKKSLVDNWQPLRYQMSHRLTGSVFGIVGIGRIGTATALRAKAFGMDVCFYDPLVENGIDKSLGIRRVESLESLFAQCDGVSLHVPLNNTTNKLIDAKILEHSKSSLVLVNTARGPVVDLDALYDALKTNAIMAAALDVLPEEDPINYQHPLLAAWADNEPWIDHRLLLTPHSAFYSAESLFDMRYTGGAIAAAYLRDGTLQNCVNAQHLVSMG